MVKFAVMLPVSRRTGPIEPASVRRGYWSPTATPISALAAASSRSAAARSGRCKSRPAGSALTANSRGTGSPPGGRASSARTDGSSRPVSATIALMITSHSACCPVRRLAASAALARARAAAAGAWKPAAAARWLIVEVSVREARSACEIATSDWQKRYCRYSEAASAATETRASCQLSVRAERRAPAASCSRLTRPKRSISQLASTLARCCETVSTEVPIARVPRLASAVASTAGRALACAATVMARARSMLAAARASVGLSRSAAAMKASSAGSLNCCHQRARSSLEPVCGKGACQRSASTLMGAGDWASASDRSGGGPR